MLSQILRLVALLHIHLYHIRWVTVVIYDGMNHVELGFDLEDPKTKECCDLGKRESDKILLNEGID